MAQSLNGGNWSATTQATDFATDFLNYQKVSLAKTDNSKYDILELFPLTRRQFFKKSQGNLRLNKSFL